MDKGACANCKHFCFATGDYGYSEYTPGWDAAMSCNRKHWKIDMFGDDEREVRRKLRMAETCKDFEAVTLEEILERGQGDEQQNRMD